MGLNIALIIVAYLLGSISWGMIVGRLSGVDLTRHESGSTGGTNAFRAMGALRGVFVGLLDVAKSALAVWLAHRFGTQPWVAAVAGVAAVVGHNYSVFIGFKGGKGVASSIGVYAVLAPIPLTMALSVALTIVYLSRLVSLASLTFILLVPMFQAAIGVWPERLVLGFALAALVFFRHRGNIRRLREGTERRLGKSSAAR